jgi:hypothetical protein
MRQFFVLKLCVVELKLCGDSKKWNENFREIMEKFSTKLSSLTSFILYIFTFYEKFPKKMYICKLLCFPFNMFSNILYFCIFCFFCKSLYLLTLTTQISYKAAFQHGDYYKFDSRKLSYFFFSPLFVLF